MNYRIRHCWQTKYSINTYLSTHACVHAYVHKYVLKHPFAAAVCCNVIKTKQELAPPPHPPPLSHSESLWALPCLESLLIDKNGIRDEVKISQHMRNFGSVILFFFEYHGADPAVNPYTPTLTRLLLHAYSNTPTYIPWQR
jgi:hypothetical protein